MKKITKRYLSLIEIMIVMFLIMMIMGVVAVNYRGALDQGKAFKTEVGIQKIEQSLEFAIAQNPNLVDDVSSDWQGILKNDPMVKDNGSLNRDGWGEEYQVSVSDGKVTVTSRKLDEYKKKHGSLKD